MVRAAENQIHSQKNCIGRPLSARNEKFIGRWQELQDIHDFLNPALRNQGQRCCAVLGLGGSGKTSLVNEHFVNDQGSYTFAAWLRASDNVTIAQDFANIAKILDKGNVSARNQVKDIETAREVLETSATDSKIYVLIQH